MLVLVVLEVESSLGGCNDFTVFAIGCVVRLGMTLSASLCLNQCFASDGTRLLFNLIFDC